MGKKSQLRNIICKFRFDDDEYKKIETAAKAENLPFAVWGRQILLEAAATLEVAREEVARASTVT